jgi:hypothetical protein
LKLEVESLDHTEQAFKKYLLEFDDYICPNRGEFSYEDGVVNCSIHFHSDEDNKDKEDRDEEVPYL